MLWQKWLNYLFFDAANRGLLRLRADVRIVLEHLIADVSGQRPNGLLGNVGALRKARHKCMSQVMPAVRHACPLTSFKPTFSPRTHRAAKVDVVHCDGTRI